MVIQLRHAPLSASTRAGFRTSLRPLVAALLLALGPRAFALPTDPTVVAGQAVVRGAGGNSLVIDQASGKAAIDWRSFNIGAGEAVRFNQPSAAAMTVNRVTSNNPSEILGLISAPGTVFLINPTGIIFGRTAVVDVGSLVASTLSASTADLLSGRAVFNAAPGGSGAVRNEGSIISAPGGSVSLIGTQVSNSGSISTPGGTTGLIAGERVSVDFEGDGLVRYQVDVGAARALVEQSGHIAADGGRVALQAGARDALVDTVLNVDGVVRARGISQRGGEIYLDGGAHGSVLVSGTLDASGAAPGTAGGQLRVLGENVGLIGGARLDASGDAGGGSVLVGGNYQGSGPEHNATRAFVGSGVTINADALGRGDGGRVITWADDWTRFYGTISARGGAAGGDGGFVEVSGKQSLAFAGSVVTSAPQGRTGTLLLDPGDLYVGANPGGGIPAATDTDSTAGVLFEADGGTFIRRDFYVLASSLSSDSKYVLRAQDNVFFNADVAFGTTGGDAAKSVSVEAGKAISSTGANSISTFGGALSLNAGTTINIGAAINTNGGVLTINSPGAATLSGGVAGVGSALVKLGTGELSLSGSNSYSGGTSIRAGTLKTLVSSTLPAGGAVSLEGSGVLNLDGKTQSIGNLSGVSTTRITLGGTQTGGLTVNQTSDGIFAGVISGSGPETPALNAGAFNKLGPAMLTLSGANTFTGVTWVSDGVLRAANPNTFPAAGANLWVQGSGTFEIDGVALDGAQFRPLSSLTLAGGLQGDAALAGRGNLSYGGTITLLGHGSVRVAGASDTLTLTGPIVGQSDTQVQADPTLKKVGNGTLVLNGSGTDFFPEIMAGTLRVVRSDVLPAKETRLGPGATLDIVNTTQTIGTLFGGDASSRVLLGDSGVLTVNQGRESDYDGSIIGGNASFFKKAGDATLHLSAASPDYSGKTQVLSGILSVGGSSNALGSGVVDVSGGATLLIDKVDLITGGLTLNGSGVGGAGALQGAGTATHTGTVTLNTASAIGAATGSDTLTVKNQVSGTGPLTKVGDGVVELSGSNIYTGGTTVEAGTLAAQNANAFGNDVVRVNNGASLLIDNVALTTGGLTLNGSGVGGAGALQGAGTASHAGAVTLATASAIGAATGSDTLTVKNQVSGTGPLTKVGDGIVELSGSNDYTGGTTVEAGTLVARNANAFGNDAVRVNNGASLLIAGVDLITGGLTLNGSGVGGAGALQGAGTATHTGAVTLNTASAIGAATASDTLTVKNQVSGTGPLTKVGDGVLELSGDNNYSGGTTIEAGTLRLLAGATLPTLSPLNLTGTGTLDLNGTDLSIGNLTGTANTAITLGSGDLTVTQGTAGTFAGQISGSGDLIKQGTAALTLSGASTGYTGTTRVQAGTLVATGSASALGTGAGQVSNGATLLIDKVDLVTGGLTLNGSGVGGAGALQGAGTASLAGTVTLAAASAIGAATASDTLTVKNQVSGTGPLTKVGDGVVELSGSNIYTGGTTVEAGTLVAQNANAFGNDAVRVNNGATLLIDDVDLITGGLTLNGSGVGGAGALQGAGTASLAGAVTLATASAIGAATGSDTLTVKNQVSGTGLFTKVGDGVVELSGSNTYTGGTTIAAGTLVARNANAFGNDVVRVNNGASLLIAGVDLITGGLTLNGSGVGGAGALQGAGTATHTGAVTLNTASAIGAATALDKLTLKNRVGGTGPLTKVGDGVLELSGDNNYTGGTTIEAGTLRLLAGATLPTLSPLNLTGTGTLDLSSTDQSIGNLTGTADTAITLGSGDLTVTQGTAGTFAGRISGSGDLIKQGTAALTLSGASTGYTGTTRVQAGTLVATGSASALGTGAGQVSNGATLLIDKVDLITGGLTLNGSGVGGAGALQGAGTASLAGTVTLAAASAIGAATASDTLTVKNQVSGTGPLTKVGDGIVEFSVSNTYTGGTTVEAGTLVARNANAFGNDVVRVDNGASLLIDNVALTTGGLTLNGSGVGGAGALQGVGTASHEGSVTLATASAIGAATASDTLTVKNQVSGTGPLTKVGDGVVELSGSNTYTGGTTVKAGTLVARNAKALGNDVVRVNNGASLRIDNVALTTGGLTLNGSGVGGAGALQGTGTASHEGSVTLATASAIGAATGSDTLTVKNQVSGTGPFTKMGDGVVELSGGNDYTGGTTVEAGTLVARNANAFGNDVVRVNNGASLLIDNVALTTGGLTLNGSGVGGAGALQGAGTASLAGAVTLATASAIGAATASDKLTLKDQVSGSGPLTKVGGGVVELSGSNTYTGGTTISEGTLVAGNAHALGVSRVGVDDGAMLRIDDVALSTGGLTLNGSGVGGAGALQGAGTASHSGAVTLATASSIGASRGSTLTLNNPVSGANLTKVGGGVVELSGSNTYTGGTTIDAGTLRLLAGATLPTLSPLNLTGTGTLDLNGTDQSISNLTGTAGTAIALGSGDLTVTQGAAGTFAGRVSGSGDFIKQGAATLTLSNASTGFTGRTMIRAGSLEAVADNALGSGEVWVQGGALNVGPAALGNSIVLAGGTLRAIGVTTLTGALSQTVDSQISSALESASLTLQRAFAGGGHQLTIDGPGGVHLAGGAGGLASIVQSAGSELEVGTGQSIVSSGAQTYGGIVKGSNVTLTSLARRAITATSIGNDFTGTLHVTAGSAQLGGGDTLSVALDTGAATLTAGRALTLSGTAASLDAKSGSGGIGQQAGQVLQVTDTTTLDAGSGAVRLTEVANKFGGLVTVKAGETVLRAGEGLNVVLDNTGATTLTAGQALTVSGTASSLDARARGGSIGQPVGQALQVAGATTLDADSEAVSLTEAANKFGGLVTVKAGQTAVHTNESLNVALDNTGATRLSAGQALTLDGIAASLEARAGGAISQRVGQALEVTGTTTLQAGREPVSLTGAANKFGGLVTVKAGQTALSASESLNVALENTDATTLTAGQSLDVSGTAASLETVSGALHFGQTKLAADGKFTAHGSVSQESASALEIGGATTLNVNLQAGESILLANRGNAFGTTLGGKIDLGLAAADSSIHSKNAVRLAKLELTGNGLLEIESSAAMGTTPVQDVRTPVSENSNCTLPRSCVSVQSFDGTPEPLSVFEASISQQKDARITTDPGVTLKLNASSAKGSIDLSAGASVSVTLAGVAQPAATGLAGLLSVYSKAGPEVRKLAYSDSDGTAAHRGTTNQIRGPLAAVTQANTSQDSPDKTAVVVASDTIRVAAKDGIDGDTVMLIAREIAGGGGKIQTHVAATKMRDGRNIRTGVGSEPDPNYSILPSIFVIADAPGGTSAAYSFGSLGNPISVSFGHVDEFTANSLLQTIAVEPYRRGEPGGVVPVYMDTRVQPGVDPNGPIRRFLVFPAGTPTGSIRMVVVDGVEILDSSAFASVQSAVAELLNQVRKELLESGFSNENVAAQLRKGVITETRVGPAAVDRFQGVAPAGGCVGTMIGEMLVCAPAAGPQQP